MNLEEIEKRAQQEKDRIIQHCKGPAIVVAGPGSGKTTTLAERLVALCNKADPTRIVAITFTNNAVDGMKKKVKEICCKLKQEPSEPRISTMHSLAKGLLHRYSDRLNLRSSFRVVNKLQEKILLDDVRWELKRQRANLGRYQNRYLKRFKASKASVSTSILDLTKIPSKKGLAAQEQFDECYSSLLDYYYSVDWYDIVALAVKLLSENSDILNEVSGTIDHLLIDEYQDLNRTDHDLIRLLSTKVKSLMVFGDDDQSIYQTGRFANSGGMKRFKKIYPSAKVYPLSICWRCGSLIIDAAWKLIDVDESLLPERMAKEKPIPNSKRGFGEFEIKSFKSEKAEIQGIYEEIKMEMDKILPPKEILILFHSKDIGQKYADILQTNGFKIQNLLGMSQMVSKEVLLFYEVLRLLNDESDNLAIRFLLQELFRRDSRWIAKARCLSKNQNKSLWQIVTKMNDATEGIRSWSENFERWRQMDNIIEILSVIAKILEIYDKSEIQKIMEWSSQEDNLTIRKVIERLEKGIDFFDGVPPIENIIEDKAIKIVIMTMHGAKGLDADVVFVPALENELIPNQWYEPEQRRLLYVSMTRAKSRLFLSWAWSRTGKVTYRSSNRAETHRKRSRFLDEIER